MKLTYSERVLTRKSLMLNLRDSHIDRKMRLEIQFTNIVDGKQILQS